MGSEPTEARVPLRRHPDFLRLWAGQTVSLLGATAGGLAIPLTAVVALEATPVQMGLLGAAGSLPSLLVGLFAGPLVDRRRRLPILVHTNLLRALLYATIPAAAVAGALGMAHLYAVAFLGGALAVFFDVSYQSYLPSLVGPTRLVEGNGKLATSASVVTLAGPGLGAALVRLVGAPLAVGSNTLGFALAGLVLSRIRQPEPEPASARRGAAWPEIAEGLKLVARHPLLRSLAARNLAFNLFLSVYGSVYMLQVTGPLGLREGEIALLMAAGGPAALLAASLAPRAQARFGVGPTLVWSAVIEGAAGWLVAVAGGPRLLALGLLVGSRIGLGLGSTAYGINQISLRQSLTPNHLLGRVNATMRFVALGASPLGALLGGWLGETVGLRPTLFVAAGGMLLGTLFLVLSPIRTLREAPGPEELEARADTRAARAVAAPG